MRSFARPPRKLLDFLLHWAPLWVPVVLLLQILILGLKPALEERGRLKAQRPAVEERHKRSRELYDKALRVNDAWQDQQFPERKKRIWYAEAEARRQKLKSLTGDQPQADDSR